MYSTIKHDICGSWGSGKTSFMRKIWAYLGGPLEVVASDGSQDRKSANRCKDWFGPNHKLPPGPKSKDGWHLIWFNPWHHQFEPNPAVALLQEIRRHFSLLNRLYDETGKLIDVTTHAVLGLLGDLGKALDLPLPAIKGKDILERGREYETEHFDTPLTSQRFRDFFEAAITKVVGPGGRMVVFVDDLDRCEGDAAYRLVESLKLHLSSHNCIYMLGMDQEHLEQAIARCISGGKDSEASRPQAREYLGKIIQSRFALPVTEDVRMYVSKLTEIDTVLKDRLTRCFGLPPGDWDAVVDALNNNLPHNPRKIKSFLASWKV